MTCGPGMENMTPVIYWQDYNVTPPITETTHPFINIFIDMLIAILPVILALMIIIFVVGLIHVEYPWNKM